ncbi:hypothetical protein DFH08DRAFT_965491 [Mycena albidolilacea]|uniref:Secreted protein n=1 Tax=Mycena albidolilacea TaxID=1033008 RepID=A0AAD7EKQ9_9AGAR|nr:hypothetical protein DFH08DRAFT_965491 [Mycena albidolilacea]
MKLLLGLLYVASLGLLGVRLAHDAQVISDLLRLTFSALRGHLSSLANIATPARLWGAASTNWWPGPWLEVPPLTTPSFSPNDHAVAASTVDRVISSAFLGLVYQTSLHYDSPRAARGSTIDNCHVSPTTG